MTNTDQSTTWTNTPLEMWAVIHNPETIPDAPPFLIGAIDQINPQTRLVTVDVSTDDEYLEELLPWTELIAVFPTREAATEHLQAMRPPRRAKTLPRALRHLGLVPPRNTP